MVSLKAATVFIQFSQCRSQHFKNFAAAGETRIKNVYIYLQRGDSEREKKILENYGDAHSTFNR